MSDLNAKMLAAEDKPAELPPLIDKTIIEPIELDDAKGRWIFEPQPDITALEAMLIAHMFSAIAIRHLHGKYNRWDWREYLTRDRSTKDWSHLVPVGDGRMEPVQTSIDLARHFRRLE